MIKEISTEYWKLLFFSIAVSIVTYGYALVNFTITIDSDMGFGPDTALHLGRWGTNVVRYHIFNGVVPYFTLLISLILLSVSAVLLAKLFRFNTIASYAFCMLFLTFPQMPYQMYFSIQSDAIALGFALSAYAVILFEKSVWKDERLKALFKYFVIILLLVFVIAIYQALVFIPIVIYLIIVFQNTYNDNFSFSSEFKKLLLFGVMVIIAAGLYAVTLPVFCPQMGQGGYLDAFTSGDADLIDRLIDANNIFVDNMRGNYFYGEKTFILASLSGLIILIATFMKNKRILLPRALVLLFLFTIPFCMSFLITNAYYHPPRIYVTMGIVFAFLLTHFLSSVKFSSIANFFLGIIVLLNIYFITRLYVSHQEIHMHDAATMQKIDSRIHALYPEFDETEDYVYFYGKLSDKELDPYRLPLSEMFASSLLQWDEGNNYRIRSFAKYCNVADYKLIDNKETYIKIKDSVNTLSEWPKKGSIKKVDNVVIVKLGPLKGAPLWVE
jgi:hypothetical protein